MAQDEVIEVVPVDGGWSVRCSITNQPLFFLSGAKAEENARKLGACIAGLGQDVRVMIHDRHSALVGTQCYFAAEGSGALPELRSDAHLNDFGRMVAERAFPSSERRGAAGAGGSPGLPIQDAPG